MVPGWSEALQLMRQGEKSGGPRGPGGDPRAQPFAGGGDIPSGYLT